MDEQPKADAKAEVPDLEKGKTADDETVTRQLLRNASANWADLDCHPVWSGMPCLKVEFVDRKMEMTFQKWVYNDLIRWIKVPLLVFITGLVGHIASEAGRLAKSGDFFFSRLVRDAVVVGLLGAFLTVRAIWPNKTHASRLIDLRIMTICFCAVGCLNAFHSRYRFSRSTLLEILPAEARCKEIPGADFGYALGMVAYWTVFKANSFLAGCVCLSMFSWLIVAEAIVDREGMFSRVFPPGLTALLLVWVSITMERNCREVIRDKHRIQKMTEEKDRFLAAQHATFAKITHDLRTPLNGVINAADFMRNDLDQNLKINSEHPIYGYVDIMSSAGEYMLLLTNNLLEVSRLTLKRERKFSLDRIDRIDRGALRRPSSSLDVTPTCCSWEGVKKTASRLLYAASQDDERRNVTTLSDVFDLHLDWMDCRAALKKVFHLHIPTTRLKKLTYEVPSLSHLPYFIYGDSVRISQAANNLLSNAVKMTEKGSVEVSVTSELAADQDGEPPAFDLAKHPSCDVESMKKYAIEIRVKDSGRGIPDDKLQSIFKEFEQVQAKDALIGTGLGLSIARMVAMAMGGDCRLESEGIDKGTTAILRFQCWGVFELNVGRRGDRSPLRQTIDATALKELMEKMQRLKIHIVLADDDFINRQSLELMITKMGWPEESMTWALNGVELVNAVKDRLNQSDAPIFLLTDLEMPESDGVAAARSIRKMLHDMERTRRAPPIFMALCTAQSKENVILSHPDASSLFDTSFIEKPVRRIVLKELFERFVARIETMASRTWIEALGETV
ncbi:unnamed protein product [Vitrella brassicaformis CCMP3155]|uniref:histidine kinase n=1 Tax=Vitrella brassicaformis (strain CCMP3155) TaxID=1169540 RepID=A0A0G4GPG0_VITBC|nr:unnamed protein product [Vitrella brassicaformis CCMP3155]|eukprot:CEM32270.1 unnamed protein product [Vitrella brassicaformis CCMP3155]